MTAEKLSAYYRNVQGYHDIIECQDLRSFVVPPELLLRFIDRDKLILDVGGGSGINVEILGLNPAKYVCGDLSFNALSIAREKGRGMLLQLDVTRLPIRDNVVNTLLCSWSFEHFAHPEAVLREMRRVLKPGGRILLWGPNWDNVFRKDFPQFAHRSRNFTRRVRWKIFFRMVRNELLPFRYDPYVTMDVAALADPGLHKAGDTDAVHCVLCQETYQWFLRSGMSILHLSDFSEMSRYLYNGPTIRTVRTILRPLLPFLRHVPLARWFAIRFPIVAEKPSEDAR